MTKRLFAFFAVFVFAVTMTVSAADARISMGADVATWLEGTEADCAGGPATTCDNPYTFGDPGANVHVYGDVASNVDAYVELIAVPNSIAGASQDNVQVNEAYLTLGGGPVGLKIGEFEVDFGNRLQNNSDFADVQGNPLVGDDLVEPRAKQAGLEISGEVAGGNMGWALAITNGTTDANFNGDRGFAYAPKIWGNFGPGLSAAFSYYAVDHSPSGVADNLLGTDGGESYQIPVGAAGFFAGLDQYSFAPGDWGGATPHDISAWQFDFGWENQMAEVNFWYGSAEDEVSTFGSALDWYGLEGAFNFTPNAYAALRYNEATDESSAPFANDSADRTQVGVGYNLNENTQAKLEWVDQTNMSTAPDAGGFIAELSASF